MLLSTVPGLGPALVLVHGIGVGPESFSRTAAALAAAGRRVHGVVRPGYGEGERDGERTMEMRRQVDCVAAALAMREEDEAVWVGVSGGATLGVIAALRRPTMIRSALLHEPLIGPAAKSVHRTINAAAEQLASGPLGPKASREAAVTFVQKLVGAEAWSALGTTGRAAVVARAEAIHAEVPRFAAFEASWAPDDGAVDVVITVGERSPAMRHEAAELAAEVLRGRVLVVPGVGHLPQVEAPTAYAEIIRRNT